MAKSKSSLFTEKSISTIASVARLALSAGESVFPEILKLCAELTEADSGNILILDKDSQTLKIVASERKGNSGELIQTEIPISAGITGRSARTKMVQYVPNVVYDSDYYRFEGTISKSEVAVPLIADERLMGVLNLESAKANNFTLEQIQVLELLSSILATALRRSELQRQDSELTESRKDSKKPVAFVLMPFRDPFNKYYRAIIKPAIEEADMQSLRVDEIFGPTEIVKDIWKAIGNAEIIIAELTTRNPNVMYELGLSHAIGKPVIMLSQNIDDVPFDLRSLRCILYDTVEPNWAEQLKLSILKSIKAVKTGNTIEPNFLQINKT